MYNKDRVALLQININFTNNMTGNFFGTLFKRLIVKRKYCFEQIQGKTHQLYI